MSTSRAQRIGIWIIAVTMTVGTVASFIAIVLSNENQQNASIQQQDQQQKLLEEYQKQQEERLATLETINGLSVTPFDAASVTGLKVDVVTEGTGETISADTTINASYTGWLSDGKIFDSSKVKNTEDKPVTFSLQQVIKGWTEGLAGQKVGSVVKLTIPADKGYGAAGSPPTIPANAPLQFYVKINSVEPAQQQ
jgi:FKBP-type peptidyl-prolyl cis-trans isomerase